MLFKKSAYTPVFDDKDVEMESSICTGEKIIGFRDPENGKLLKAVAVREQKDIDDFYREHRLINNKHFTVK